jgi:hypothetical protein
MRLTFTTGTVIENAFLGLRNAHTWQEEYRIAYPGGVEEWMYSNWHRDAEEMPLAIRELQQDVERYVGMPLEQWEPLKKKQREEEEEQRERARIERDLNHDKEWE